jgi:mannitol-1-phosphate/altronate dehydrogenase
MKNQLRLRLSDTLVLQIALHRFMREMSDKMETYEKRDQEYQTVFDLWQTSGYIMRRLNDLHDEQVSSEHKLEVEAFAAKLKVLYKKVAL